MKPHPLRSHTASSLRGIPLRLNSLQPCAVSGTPVAALSLGPRARSLPREESPTHDPDAISEPIPTGT